MELVYLWVEDYKNIHHKGFNFSPRFYCEYKDETLTIKKNIDEKGNKKYIENFFGDNINITAIVGKNGSGKSSLFEILAQILILKNKIKYFYIINNGINNICYSNHIKLDNCPIKCELYIPIHQIDKELKHSNYNVQFANYVNIYYLNISHLERDFIIKNDVPPPEDNGIKYLGIYAKNDFDLMNTKDVNPSFSIFNLEKFNFLETYKVVHLLKNQKYKEQLFKVFNIKEPKYIKLHPDITKLTEIKRRNSIQKKGYSVDDKVPPLIDEIFKFLDTLDKDKKIEINSDNYKKLFRFQNFSDVIKLEFLNNDSNSIRFSAGEKTVLFYIVRIYNMLQEIRDTNKTTILLWDEIELYLHPLWQKKILDIIINFIYIEKLDKFLHIIIASHSPFLLSDIPKQNIIFLDKDEKGNCKVVDGLKEKKQTFGANIHTLLSDSFFMEDGLMGEFAKGKIDDVINYLHDKESKIKSDDEAQKLIHIIGEPIVKNQLQRMLDSRRLSNIDIVNQKIKEMSYELEILKQYQSKIVQDELRDKGKKQYKQRFEDD